MSQPSRQRQAYPKSEALNLKRSRAFFDQLIFIFQSTPPHICFSSGILSSPSTTTGKNKSNRCLPCTGPVLAIRGGTQKASHFAASNCQHRPDTPQTNLFSRPGKLVKAYFLSSSFFSPFRSIHLLATANGCPTG